VRRSPAGRLIAAWLTTGVCDGLFASVQSYFYGSNPARVFRGVASVLLGPSAMQGGAKTAVIGLAMHFGVAFVWSAIFVFVVSRWPVVVRTLRSPGGVPKVAAVYGPCIWLIMSLMVIPLLVRRAPAITIRWVVQLVGHAIFVGLPIVALGSE
jgi:hypothetical protein